ncbi:hypothetical protein [Candidatus Methanodesulfokora washburnensis]|jgi:metal-responsive CopG/Arc/MetJ family transcriptional regulator|nr:hypothetical protein [Candidatus Methanodesulfokores washburnensis]
MSKEISLTERLIKLVDEAVRRKEGENRVKSTILETLREEIERWLG